MNLLTWVFVGIVCGIGTSFLLGKGKLLNWRINLVGGVVGAIFAGIFITPWFDIETINQRTFSMPSLLVSLGGAVILLVVMTIVRRVRTNTPSA